MQMYIESSTSINKELKIPSLFLTKVHGLFVESPIVYIWILRNAITLNPIKKQKCTLLTNICRQVICHGIVMKNAGF